MITKSMYLFIRESALEKKKRNNSSLITVRRTCYDVIDIPHSF